MKELYHLSSSATLSPEFLAHRQGFHNYNPRYRSKQCTTVIYTQTYFSLFFKLVTANLLYHSKALLDLPSSESPRQLTYKGDTYHNVVGGWKRLSRLDRHIHNLAKVQIKKSNLVYFPVRFTKVHVTSNTKQNLLWITQKINKKVYMSSLNRASRVSKRFSITLSERSRQTKTLLLELLFVQSSLWHF